MESIAPIGAAIGRPQTRAQVFLAGLGLEVQGNSLARAITFANNARSAGLSVMLTVVDPVGVCLLYTSPSPRDKRQSRMPSSA